MGRGGVGSTGRRGVPGRRSTGSWGARGGGLRLRKPPPPFPPPRPPPVPQTVLEVLRERRVPVSLWILVGSALGGLLLLAAISVCLWKVRGGPRWGCVVPAPPFTLSSRPRSTPSSPFILALSPVLALSPSSPPPHSRIPSPIPSSPILSLSPFLAVLPPPLPLSHPLPLSPHPLPLLLLSPPHPPPSLPPVRFLHPQEAPRGGGGGAVMAPRFPPARSPTEELCPLLPPPPPPPALGPPHGFRTMERSGDGGAGTAPGADRARGGAGQRRSRIPHRRCGVRGRGGRGDASGGGEQNQ